MTDEQRELMRIAARSALDHSRGGRDLAPEARRWALHWAAKKQLGRPPGTGEPNDDTLPPPLRGGALEIF